MVATVFDSPEPELEPVVGEAPMMMGNSTLSKRLDRRKSSSPVLKFGIPFAVVALALAGGAVLFTQQKATPLVIPPAPEDVAPVQTAAVNPPAPLPEVKMAPVAPVAPPAVSAPTRAERLAVNAPPRAVVRHAPRVARSADTSNADVSAQVPISAAPANPAPVMVAPPPVVVAAPPASEPAPSPQP